MTDDTTTTETQTTENQQDKTFSQDEVNSIIKDRLAQQAKNKFGDYEDLKAKADGAKTIEQKLTELEQKNAAAEARALRSDIAAKHGISAEDRDLFLTGSDEAALEAQAKRLAEKIADQKKNGLRARKEGQTVQTNLSPKDKAKRDWLASLRGDDA